MAGERGSFNTKRGIILATAGPGVSFGNIWCFPDLTGQDDDAAFLLRFACSLCIGEEFLHWFGLI